MRAQRKTPRGRRRVARRESDEAQVGLLGESLLFEALDRAGREMLASRGIVHLYRAGEMIIREGDVGDSLVVLFSGRVRMYAQRGGTVVELGTLSRPACFGESSVLSGRPRAETVEALEDTRVISYSRDHLEKVLRRYPDIRRRIEALVLGRAKAALHAIERRRS